MKIEIKEENYKQLVQCVYLGNMVINEYRNKDGIKTEYSDFTENILTQIVKSAPVQEPKFKFKNFRDTKSDEVLFSDLSDRIFDSVKQFYDDFCNALFCETLADKIADRNYPVNGYDEDELFDNFIAKHIYYEILKYGTNGFAHIDAPKIDRQIARRTGEIL